MRTTIQNKIKDLCLNGTFAKVSYTVGTDEAVKDDSSLIVPKIVVNEIQGTLTPAAGRSPRSRRLTQSTWAFEAKLKFSHEVDITYFLDNELDLITVTEDNQLARTNDVSYYVNHAPRQGGVSGTELVMTFSLTVRR